MYHIQETEPFVPFCDTVIRRYAGVQELPPHDIMDRRLCHGEIRLTLTAKTPLMISGGIQTREDAVSVALFTTDAHGRFRIPGSSLRGLIRQNMQILGLGLFRVGDGDEIPGKPVAGGKRPADGLPASYRIPEDQDFLDYPRSIMGFIGRRRKVQTRFGKIKYVSDCYRSRVSIGDLHPVGVPRELRTVLLQQKLPRQDNEKFIVCENGQFRLRGTRQYPLREVSGSQTVLATQGFRPLDAGTQFTGSIRYRNLHPDELGLLLWCLQLDAGCRHTLGMGKSAGYGQIALKIDELLEFDPDLLYSSLTAGGIHRGHTDSRIAELIGIYQQKAAVLANVESLPRMSHIQKFLQLKGFTPLPNAQRKPDAPVSAEQNQPAVPSQKASRKQAKNTAPQVSDDQFNSMRDLLSSHFKGN